jgi:hypothetical protein
MKGDISRWSETLGALMGFSYESIPLMPKNEPEVYNISTSRTPFSGLTVPHLSLRTMSGNTAR